MILEHCEDNILTLTIDRPASRNAFDAETTEALAAAIERIGEGPQVRVLVIRGAGGHFSAGRDLKSVESGSEPRPELLQRHEDWVRIFHALHRLPVPSLAVVQGFAVAGGFTLAMGCDFVIAERGARFGALEMRNGFPASVCTPILARLLGPRLGLELALFGEPVAAARLYEMGLINRLVDGEEALEQTAQEFARHIARLDPEAVKLTRETFRAAENMPIDNALDMGKHLNQLLATSGWFAEGAARGLKKKP
jgi:enoyl-CoA hydratase/carnithine racemase